MSRFVPNYSKNKKKTINVPLIIQQLLKNWWLLLVGTLIAAMLSYVFVTETYEQTYTTSATVAVAPGGSQSSSALTNLENSRTMAMSFVELLNSSTMRNKVLNAIGMTSFNGTITATQRTQTIMHVPNVQIVLSQKNLRLNAYKPLFGLARGKFIVDLDDDIIEFPNGFDKTIVEYFDAFPDYGFIGLNVVCNEKTNGHKPGSECYKLDVRGERVIEEGPVGGWCAAFRRSHFRLFRLFFNMLNLSIARVEDGVLSGFLHVLLRKRQGIIRDAVCLHATGPYYAREFGLLQREAEKYQAAGLTKEAQEFSQ